MAKFNKKIILAATMSVVLLVQPMLAIAQDYGLPSAAQISEAMQEGKAIAQEAANAAKNVGLQANDDGSATPVGASNESLSMESKLKYVQSVTGVGDVVQTANPGRGMVAGGGASIEGSKDVSCKLARGSFFMIAGVEFMFSGCDTSEGQPKVLNAKVCALALKGDSCSDGTGRDFGPVTLKNGEYMEKDGINYGLGCNAEGACRVHVSGSYAVQGSGEQLTKQAKDNRAAESENSLSASLTNTLLSEEIGYSDQVLETGTEMQTCFQNSARSVQAGGPPLKCDGSAAEGVDGILKGASTTGERPAICDQPAKCLQYKTTTSTHTKSCARTFPLTVRSSTLHYEQLLTCTISEGDNTCTPEEGEDDPRAGLTQVGEETVCLEEGDDGGCKKEESKIYYIDMRSEAVRVLRESASPSPVSKTNPTCDDSRVGKNSTCDGGDWFGRTVSDNECVVLYKDEDGNPTVEQLSFAEKEGCGVCVTPTVHQTCYGEPSPVDEEDSCDAADLRGCYLIPGQTKAASFSHGDGTGLVISQEDTYECHTERRICAKFEEKPAECQAASPETLVDFSDLINVAESANSFGNAMAQAAVLDGIAKGLQDSNNPTFPLIFNGEDLRCSRPTGGIGGLLTKNCCRTDLQRPKKGNLIQKGCGDDEVKLAASRRASTAVYVGEYCSKKMKFPKKCLRITQTYCAFQGTLARIIHEQGRTQLAQLVNSSSAATTKKSPMNFNYYSNKPTGEWTEPVMTNGVTTRAWQYPSYCRSPEATARAYEQNQEAPDCPASLELWIAACDVPTGCGEPPGPPEEGAVSWGLQSVNPLKSVTTAVSRYAVVNGACDPSTEKCAYTVTAWPAGVGGKVTVARDINFELYSTVPTPEGVPLQPVLGNAADIMYRAYSIEGSIQESAPATVRIDFSTDGGQKWQTESIPTNLNNKEIVIPGTDVTLTGGCSATANACNFRMTGTSVVRQKPWGSAQRPDCTGFTPGQIGAMDFGRMDLSEWIDEVVTKASSQAETMNSTLAASAIKNQLAIYTSPDISGNSSAQLTGKRPSINVFAIATPGEGYGPFNATIKTAGRFPFKPEDPTSGEPVLNVTVDWGDCSEKEYMTHIDTYDGQPANGFTLAHRYLAPNADKHYTCGIGREDTVHHSVALTVHTPSGQHVVSLEVVNSWNSVSGKATGNIAATEESKTVTIQK